MPRQPADYSSYFIDKRTNERERELVTSKTWLSNCCEEFDFVLADDEVSDAATALVVVAKLDDETAFAAPLAIDVDAIALVVLLFAMPFAGIGGDST